MSHKRRSRAMMRRCRAIWNEALRAGYTPVTVQRLAHFQREHGWWYLAKAARIWEMIIERGDK